MPGGPGRFGRGSSGPALLRVPTARGPPPPTGLSPPAGRPSSRFGPAGRALPWALLPRGGPKTPPVWAPAPLARRYAGHHCCLLLLRLLGCFGSPGARPLAGAPGLQPGGLPHSDTPGSPALCASPGIFAAKRVLHRLREPGHPPCALPSLPARSRRAAAPSRARRRPRAGLGPFLSSASSSSVFLCLAAPAPRGGRRARCAVPMNDAWRMPASNRRPPACKAGALPAELIPPRATPPGVVPPGFEPGASTLSVWRSDRLSYGTRPRPARRRGRGPWRCGARRRPRARAVQKGGVPAAPSGTATLLRLSPSHRYYPSAPLAVTHFRYPRLPWLDGRCVQGPGTYSPRHG